MKDTALDYTLVNKVFSLEIQVHKVSQYSIVSTLFLHKHLINFQVLSLQPSQHGTTQSNSKYKFSTAFINVTSSCLVASCSS